MKIIPGLLITGAILFTGCENRQSPAAADATATSKKIVDAKESAKKLNDLLKKYEEPSQFYKISNTEPTEVKGKQGTIISVNPVDLEGEDGQAGSGNIEVELKELVNQEQLLKTNAQTMSGDKLLVSGGAYYINITSGGRQLKLKEGKTLPVKFPKLTNNDMSLFYGQRDSLGKMDWGLTDQTFKSQPSVTRKLATTDSAAKGGTKNKSRLTSLIGYIKNDSSEVLTKEERARDEAENKLSEKVYEAINLKSFGWINCDRFMDTPNKTNLYVTFNKKDSIESANIYMVYTDINSIMQTYYYKYNEDENTQSFSNIPMGYKVNLIAYAIKNEKIFLYTSNLTITNNQTLALTLTETNENDLTKLFHNLSGNKKTGL